VIYPNWDSGNKIMSPYRPWVTLGILLIWTLGDFWGFEWHFAVSRTSPRCTRDLLWDISGGGEYSLKMTVINTAPISVTSLHSCRSCNTRVWTDLPTKCKTVLRRSFTVKCHRNLSNLLSADCDILTSKCIRIHFQPDFNRAR